MRNVAGQLIALLGAAPRETPYSWTDTEAPIGAPVPADYAEPFRLDA
jgi:hypothetical protein